MSYIYKATNLVALVGLAVAAICPTSLPAAMMPCRSLKVNTETRLRKLSAYYSLSFLTIITQTDGGTLKALFTPFIGSNRSMYNHSNSIIISQLIKSMVVSSYIPSERFTKAVHVILNIANRQPTLEV